MTKNILKTLWQPWWLGFGWNVKVLLHSRNISES